VTNQNDSLSPADRSASNAALRAALRAGDPAADGSALDSDRLRRRLRSAGEERARRPAWGPWLPIAAVAASLAVLWLVVAPFRQTPPRSAPVRAASGAETEFATETVASGGELRQMQFETPGGTRIIWVMPAHLD
jgi:hypothetical protein